MDAPDKLVRKWLKDQRRLWNLTQAGLGRELGYSTDTIKSFENGRRPPNQDLADRLVTFFKVAPIKRDLFVTFILGQGSPGVAWESIPRPLAVHLPPTNLPTPANTIIGREGQISRVCTLLTNPTNGLVTLWGPPGIGKTRLAIAVGDRLRPVFAQGVFWIGLAAVRNPLQLPLTVAQVLGIEELNNSVLDTLKAYLRDKEILLVLDNFEQLIPAANQISALLEVAPGLKVLVTSRIVLHIRGEISFPVPRLGLLSPAIDLTAPDPKALAMIPAIALFELRARTVDNTFTVTAENAHQINDLCTRLDGLPLAIELAAARINLLSPGDMLNRLDARFKWLTGGAIDLLEHQQRLESTIDWSYGLLTEPLQRLWCRLAVFRKSWSLDAAEEIGTTDEVPRESILESLGVLVDGSLVTRSDSEPESRRFTMLETLQQYAQQQLDRSGETNTLRLTHTSFFLTLAETAAAQLCDTRQDAALARLDADYPNIQAALEWNGSGLGDSTVALRISAALGWFWFLRGYWNEGRRWLEDLLSRPLLQAPTLERAGALFGAGLIAREQGDFAGAEVHLRESAALYRREDRLRQRAAVQAFLAMVLLQRDQLAPARSLLEATIAELQIYGESWELALSIACFGFVHQTSNDHTAARALCLDSLHRFRDIGDKWGQGMVLSTLGFIARKDQDYKSARGYYEASLILERELGNKSGINWLLSSLAYLDLLEKNIKDAAIHYQESLTLQQKFGYTIRYGYALNGQGEIARMQGDFRRAAEFYSESLVVFRNLDHQAGQAWALHNLGQVALNENNMPQAIYYLKESLILHAKSAEQVGVASCLAGLAVVAVAQQRTYPAAQLLGSAAAILATSQTHLDPVDEDVYTRVRASVQQQLTPEEWNTLWRQGHELSLDEIIKMALQAAKELA